MSTERSPRLLEAVRLDAEHPWPGLLAYEEAFREFFHGRSVEAAELLRLVGLAPLTVLYGRSGLGKSSLLQAGLFPLLRVKHYVPVYCRIDFSASAAYDPLEQIAQRLEKEIARVGAEAPARKRDEGLWEYLHRSDVEIWSSDNFPLTPVLVLDQFEELFRPTTGGGAEQVTRVFTYLADLIENRIPAELATEEATVRRSRLDLSSQRYRLLLSFREDYLADVKKWESKVPSLLRDNFVRLEPMTCARAIEAVELAGKAVLEDGVASLIVDSVGKLDTDPDAATVEPTLLSLFCEQLNRRRGDKRIDKSLIEGSGADILQHFYRDALEADDVTGPPDVATFIENYLVVGDRYRVFFPKAQALEAGFLSPRQLEALTGPRHRLLRVVEYDHDDRIELIHDCLVPVVCKDRDERRSREAQAERERKAREAQAELQRKAADAEARAKEKEQYNRRLVSQRYWLRVAVVGALAAAVWAGLAWWKATQAEKRAMAYAAVGGSYRARENLDLSALLALQALSLAEALDDPEAAARNEFPLALEYPS